MSILIVFITLLVASIGAMSAIGICERCKIERGGVYFLISHVLGGQTASAVGVLYCFGQVGILIANNVRMKKHSIWLASLARIYIPCPLIHLVPSVASVHLSVIQTLGWSMIWRG